RQPTVRIFEQCVAPERILARINKGLSCGQQGQRYEDEAQCRASDIAAHPGKKAGKRTRQSDHSQARQILPVVGNERELEGITVKETEDWSQCDDKKRS